MPRRKAGACETCVSTVVPIVLYYSGLTSPRHVRRACAVGVRVGLGRVRWGWVWVCAPPITCVNVCVCHMCVLVRCGCVHAGGRGERRKQKVRQTLGIGMG